MLAAAETLLRAIADLGGAAALIARAIAEIEGIALCPSLERARAAPPPAGRPSPRELAAARAKRYRANLPKRAAEGLASSPAPAPTAHPDEGARHAESVTERDGGRDGERDASRSSVTERDALSRSLSLSFSEISEAWREGERESARASASRSSVTERDGERDASRSSVTERDALSSPLERPPPSGTPELAVRAWLTKRGIDPDHCEAAHFVDVYRNAAPKRDWPAVWRNFLRAEARAPARGPGIASAKIESGEAYRARVAAADAEDERRRRELVRAPPLIATVFGKAHQA